VVLKYVPAPVQSDSCVEPAADVVPLGHAVIAIAPCRSASGDSDAVALEAENALYVDGTSGPVKKLPPVKFVYAVAADAEAAYVVAEPPKVGIVDTWYVPAVESCTTVTK
jgi:hypothetical protein